MRGIGIVVLLFSAISGYGQDLRPPVDIPKIVPATPNATKITDFYAQRPNMYTGTANVSIPFYTIDFDGWSIPVSISYNATGIRASEESSEIGLGWALSATGVISRSVNGGDDFFDGGLEGRGKGYVVSEKAVTRTMGYDDGAHGGDGSQPPSNSYYFHLADKKPDTQPDVFNYNFFGYSGSFVITRGSAKVVKITQDACLIDFDLANKKFTITTPQGFKGTFDVKEQSTTVTSAEGIFSESHVFDCCSMLYIDATYLAESSGQFRTITSWYLSKIVSPRGREINFTYDLVNGRSYNISSTRSFAERPDESNGKRVCIQTIQEHVYLTSISSDEVQLNFQMVADRDDLRRNRMLLADPDSEHSGTNPNPLTNKNFPKANKLKRYSGLSVVGLNGSSLNKTISLQQSYFNQNYYKWTNDADEQDDDKEVQYLRLKLDRVKIDDQEYSFYYEKANELPSKFTSGVDHFGFPNGDISIPIGGLLPPQIDYPRPVIDPNNLADTLTVERYRTREGREVNFNFGKAGILSKVIYPTGGYTKFTYESHRYYPENSLFIQTGSLDSAGFAAGGARIKTIEEFDYNNNTPKRTRRYYYENDPAKVNSMTTGKIMTPLYNRYPRLYYNATTHQATSFFFIRKTFSSIPGSQSAQGKVIGYSKVHEIVEGTNDSFRNTYYFENNPNVLLSFNAFAAGTPNLNGQLIQTRNYSAAGKVVQNTVNSDYNHPVNGKVLGMMYESSINNTYLVYYVPFTLERQFIQPYTVTTTTSITPSDITETNRHIDSFGSSSQVVITSTYHDSTRLLTSQSIVNSRGETIKTQYKRPFDYSTPSAMIDSMKSVGVRMIDPVIEEIVTKNGQVISAKANQYVMRGSSPNKFPVLNRSYLWNNSTGAFTGSTNGSTFASPYELKIAFNEYDNLGKIRQYTASDGIINSFIWGYNNTLPVAHGIDITYAQLKAAHDAAQGSNYETLVRSHANTAGKQITTYQHDPLVGIKKVTNPSKLQTSYNYDQYQRLKSILDNNGNTLEQYELNYHQDPPVYTATASATQLDWGVQVPGTFNKDLIFGKYYPSCASPTRTVTVTNTGTADIMIETALISSAFRADIDRVIIMPGNSIPINIKFNPDSSLTILQTYTAQLNISLLKANDHSSVGSLSVSLKGELKELACPQSTTVNYNFGTTTMANKTADIVIPNTSNAGYRLTSYSWIENGQPFEPPMVWYYSVDANDFPSAGCVMPNSDATNPRVTVNFHSPDVTINEKQTILLVKTNRCPAIQVNLKGWRRGPEYARHLKAQFLGSTLLEPAMDTEVYTQIRITNDGEDDLYITDIVKTNSINPPTPDNTFSISETAFTLLAGASKDLTVTFKPGLYDLNQHQVAFNITTAGVQPEGAKTFTMTGKRKTVKSLKFSVGGILVSTTSKQFATLHDNQTISVVNDGNSPIGFTQQSLGHNGISYSYPNPNGGSSAPSNQSPYFEATLNNYSDFGPLDVPRVLTVMMKNETSNNPERQYINLEYDATSGIPQTYLEAIPWFSKLSMPSTVTLPGSESAEFSGTITLTNTGVAPLVIYGLSISDASRFSLVRAQPISSENPITIAANNGTATITIKYNASTYDFTERSATLTFMTNMTEGGGNVMTVKAKRILRRGMSITPNPVIYNSANNSIEITVINNGNNEEYINSWNWTSSTGSGSYPSSQFWSVPTTPNDFLNTAIAPIEVNANAKRTLSIRLNSYTPNPEGIALTYNSYNSGLADLTTFTKLETKFKIMAYPSGPLDFATFTGNSQDLDVAITAEGNEELNISSAAFVSGNSDNQYFSIISSPTKITPGTPGIVKVRYTSGSFDQRSASLYLISDAGTFSPPSRTSVTLRAKRTQMPPSASYEDSGNLTLKFSNPSIMIIVTNTSNVEFTISGDKDNNTGYPQLFNVTPMEVNPGGGGYSTCTSACTGNSKTVLPGEKIAFKITSSGFGGSSYSDGNMSFNINFDGGIKKQYSIGQSSH